MQEIGQDIIERYKPYQNTTTKWKKHTVGKETLEIDEKYQIVFEAQGSGKFDKVVLAKYKNQQDVQEFVVIHKYSHPFTSHSYSYFGKRHVRQLKLHRLLKPHENILGSIQFVLPKSRKLFRDIYVIQKTLDTFLNVLIKHNSTLADLTDEHWCFFLYQILRGLKYLHSAGIIHRNLNTSNITVNSDCNLKITNLSLAKPIFAQPKISKFQSYIGIRWYRAPESLLSYTDETKAMDIWSAGCIFGQLMLGKTLFRGQDTKNQLELLLQYIDMSEIQNIQAYPPGSKELIKKEMASRPPTKDLATLFPNSNPHAIDLLKKMLEFNPEKRITAEQALAHVYLSEYHLQSDQPVSEPLDYQQFQFQDLKLNCQQLADLAYQEILMHHFPHFKEKHQSKKANLQPLYDHIINSSNSKFPFDDDN